MVEKDLGVGEAVGPWERCLAVGRRHPLGVTALFLSFLLGITFPGAASLKRVPFASEMLAGSDLTHFNYPMRFLLAEGVRRGHIPLWTDAINGGFPVHAEGQGGFLYPLNLLLALFPLPAAIHLFFLATYVGAGLLMFLYLREVGGSQVAAFFSALVFAFSGFLLCHIRHMNLIASAQWLPLLLLLVERYARTRRPLCLLAMAPVQALQHLAGHPQVTYYSILFAGAYLLVRLLFWPEALGGNNTLQGTRHPRAWGVLAAMRSFAAVTALGAGLAGAQLLPSFELMHFADRPAMASWTQATFHTFPPLHLLTLVAPFAFGDPGRNSYSFFWRDDSVVLFWENTGYVGLVPLALALFAVPALARRNRWVRLLAGAAFLSLLLALGKHTPLFLLLWRVVPGVSAFRVPSRFLLITDFALAALAGLGLDAVLGRLSAKQRRWRWALASVVVAVTAVDLAAFGARQCALVEANSWLGPSPAAQRLAAEGPPARVLSWGHTEAWLEAVDFLQGWRENPEALRPLLNAMFPNHNVLQGVPNFVVYSGFTLPDKGMVLNCWADLFSDGRPEAIRLGLRLLGLYSVAYLVTTKDCRPGGAQPLGTFPVPGTGRSLHLYRNPYALPRAYVAARARRCLPPQETLLQLFDSGFDPRRQVFLGEILAGADVASPAVSSSLEEEGHIEPSAGQVRWVQADSGRLVLEVETTRDAWLVLNDYPYPGWQVRVDGKRMPLFRANLLARAVPVPAGHHEVVFSYQPASWRYGLFISGISLMLLPVLAVLYTRAFARPRGPATL